MSTAARAVRVDPRRPIVVQAGAQRPRDMDRDLSRPSDGYVRCRDKLCPILQRSRTLESHQSLLCEQAQSYMFSTTRECNNIEVEFNDHVG